MEQTKLHFIKYEGCGNHFIFIENRDVPVSNKVSFVPQVCTFGTSIGADGVIFVEKQGETVYWEYWNKDGTTVAMCGNGARCVAWHATLQKWDCRLLRNNYGIIQRFFLENQQVSVEMPKVVINEVDPRINELSSHDLNFEAFYQVGVPHAVFRVLDEIDIEKLSPNPIGEAVRNIVDVNTNIYKKGKDDVIAIRTYERGVYDETLACGSGCCSVAFHLWSKENPRKDGQYRLKVRSGALISVRVELDGTVFLSGPTRKVFEGRFEDFYVDRERRVLI